MSEQGVETIASNKLFRDVFNPRSVAVVGATDDFSKVGARPVRFLRESAWAGRLYPVNPSREEIQGLPAWPSVSDLPEVPDHVLVATRTEFVVDVVRECAALGVGAVTIVASGFAEAGEDGLKRVAELQDIVSGTRTRLIGPSSLGIVDMGTNLKLTANAAFAEVGVRSGDTFVASQSGSIIGAVWSRGSSRSIGFSSLISTGNEIDITLGEICESSLEDPQNKGYLLFLESLTAADDLQRFARDAWKRGKPVLAMKLGASDEAAELSVSHTGALAGDDRVSGELLADCGIARVTVFEGLWEGQALARRMTAPSSFSPLRRVGIVATTGGGGAMLIDKLSLAGVTVEPPSDSTLHKLAEQGIDCERSSLIDLTLAGAKASTMGAALDVILNAPEFDLVIVAVGSSARHQPESTIAPIVERADASVPVAVFVVPDAPGALDMLDSAGVSAFRTPEACADVVAALSKRRNPRQAAIRPAKAAASTAMDEFSAYSVLDVLEIPRAPGVLIGPDEQLPAIPFEAPYVVKVNAREIAHKSDIGGVVLGVEENQLGDTLVQVARAAVGSGLVSTAPPCLVQPMVTGLAEVIVGYRQDPYAGPIVVLGVGGIEAELHTDQALRLAPVSPETALQMIAEVRGLRRLTGFRGQPEGDLTALADIIVKVSRIAEKPELGVTEAEMNPIVVKRRGDGAVAVDALILGTRSAGGRQ